MALKVADLSDPAVGGPVYLDNVKMFAGGDGAAVLAFAARFAVRAPVKAVKRLRDEARGRGLAASARPRKKIGMPKRAFPQRFQQHADSRALPDHVGKCLGPVSAV